MMSRIIAIITKPHASNPIILNMGDLLSGFATAPLASVIKAIASMILSSIAYPHVHLDANKLTSVYLSVNRIGKNGFPLLSNFAKTMPVILL